MLKRQLQKLDKRKELKIVIDTNVLISGIFWTGPPQKILQACFNDLVIPVASEEIIDEYLETLNEISQKNKIELPENLVQSLLDIISCYEPVKLKNKICKDVDDDKFISCAIAAKAGIIITGDKLLLLCNRYNNIEIIRPRQFIESHLSG